MNKAGCTSDDVAPAASSRQSTNGMGTLRYLNARASTALRVLAWAASLGGFVNPTSAAEWRTVLPNTDRADVRVATATAAPDSGFVLYLRTSEPIADWAQAYDAQGVATGEAVRVTSTGWPVAHSDGFRSLRLNSFEGVPRAIPPESVCVIAGEFAGQTTQHFWASPSPSYRVFTPQPNVSRFVPNLNGYDIWGAYYALSYFGPDCHRRSSTPLDGTGGLIADPEDQFAYLLQEGSGDGTASRPARLRRLAMTGVEWEVGFEMSRLRTMALDGDALLLIEGQRLLRFAGDGRLEWSTDLPSSLIEAQIQVESDRFVLFTYALNLDAPLRQQLAAVSRDGRLLWQREQIGFVTNGGFRAASGDVWYSLYARGPSPNVPDTTPVDVARLGPEGVFTDWRELPAGSRVLTRLPDGRLLLLSGDAVFAETPQGGEAQQIALPELTTPSTLLALEGDARGSALVRGVAGTVLDIQSLDAGGNLRWRRATELPPPLPGVVIDDLRLALSATDLCVLVHGMGHTAWRCWSRETGSPRGEWLDATSVARSRSPPRLLEDGSLLLFSSVCTEPLNTEGQCPTVRTRLSRFSVAGEPLGESIPERSGAPFLWQQDSASFASWLPLVDRPPAIAVHSDAGELLAQLTVERPITPLMLSARHTVLAREDDSEQGSGIQLVQLADDVSQRWRRTLEAGESYLEIHGVESLPDGDWLVFHNRRADRLNGLMRLSGEDGRVVWSTLTTVSSGTARPLLVATGSHAIVLQRGTPLSRAQAFDLATGEPRDAYTAGRELPDELLTARPELLAVADDQGVTIATLSGEQELGIVERWRPQQRESADTRGLQGIWHARDAVGQGLLLHGHAHGPGLSGAWFAFDSTGDSLGRGQRWYSLLSAESLPANGEVALQIFSSSGGEFATRPAQSTLPVGRAWLSRFHDDTALLRYHFDAGEMAGTRGSIPLVRTAGDGSACCGAASAGGSFFDPALDGQGLLFETLRDESGKALMAGAWFTYDPPRPDGEPSPPRWFTFLGEQQNDGSFDAQVFWTRSPGFGTFPRSAVAFDLGSTRNTATTGALSLRFVDCANIELDYVFGEAGTVDLFTGRSGSMSLQRISRCPE